MENSQDGCVHGSFTNIHSAVSHDCGAREMCWCKLDMLEKSTQSSSISFEGPGLLWADDVFPEGVIQRIMSKMAAWFYPPTVDLNTILVMGQSRLSISAPPPLQDISPSERRCLNEWTVSVETPNCSSVLWEAAPQCSWWAPNTWSANCEHAKNFTKANLEN